MAKWKILVVDDQQDCVDFVKAILGSDEREVISARDGVIGLEKARSEEPNLIVLDVQMPRKDGFEMFHDLRTDKKTAEIPVIMLTGVSGRTGIKFSKKDMGEFLGSEPEAYIEKPIDPDALEEAVDKILAD
jgi:two-component system alkaline phosphatase synthesis response regulator PhoP